MSVNSTLHAQIGRRTIPVSPVDSRAGSVNIEDKAGYRMGCVGLDVSTLLGLFTRGDANAVVKIVSAVRFVRNDGVEMSKRWDIGTKTERACLFQKMASFSEETSHYQLIFKSFSVFFTQ